MKEMKEMKDLKDLRAPHPQRNERIVRAHTFKEMKEIPPHTLKEMKEIISIVAWVKSQWVPGMTQAHLKQPGSYYCYYFIT